MRLVEDVCIQSGDAKASLALLRGLRNHTELQAAVHCVYVFSLTDSLVPYPSEPGKVIYIGEAWRAKQTGTRFGGHISSDLLQGNNYVSNRTLSAYYHNNHKLRLQIYVLNVTSSADRKAAERRLIALHVRRFGARPIAQGATGSSYTAVGLRRLMVLPAEEAALAP
jgi:hypothetical protein